VTNSDGLSRAAAAAKYRWQITIGLTVVALVLFPFWGTALTSALVGADRTITCGQSDQPAPLPDCTLEPAFYYAGLGFVALIWIAYGLTLLETGQGLSALSPARAIEGADGRASTSKFQFFVWTGTVLFAYVAIYVARLVHGHDLSFFGDLPRNTLIVTGSSIVTLTAAKAITSNQVANGLSQKTSVASPSPPAATTPTITDTTGTPAPTPVAPVKPPVNPGAAALFQDDDGILDISKLQLVAWTTIGVVWFVLRVGEVIMHYARPPLPEIDPALMALMGFGQAAYLGKKLVTQDTPTLSGARIVEPTPSTPQPHGLLFGNSLGDSPPGGQILFDSMPINVQAVWKDTQIDFPWPAVRLDGRPWRAADTVQVGVLVGGRSSSNTLPLTVTPDVQAALAPAHDQ